MQAKGSPVPPDSRLDAGPFLFGPVGGLSPNPADDWRLMAHPGRTTLILAVVAALLLVFFRAIPEADIGVSRLFFVSGDECGPTIHCGLFPADQNRFWDGVREVGLALPRIAMGGVLIWWLWSIFLDVRKTRWQLAASFAGVVSMTIGPWLLVNAGLKAFLGRPRPIHTEEFGGVFPYVPPGTPSEYCLANCSFVSGEAAAAFWMVWLVLLVPPRHRTAALAVVLPLATLISLLRVAFGRHYISDVSVAACIGAGTVTLTVWALQTEPGRAFIARWCALSNRLAAERFG